MKSIYSKLVLISLLLVTATASVSARECVECKKVNAKSKAVQAKAAACKRAQSTAELNINNVRALINGYGNMWYDGSVAQYHLPKNSNTCPLYCAALWIGGTDVNDQLRIAALRFGSEGDDYWPGPLKVNGTAAVDLPVCNAYDKHWIITKAEVMEHLNNYDNPEYQMPDVIANWPAKGQGDDLTNFLAPFKDVDDDLEYNPAAGDYPYYDFNNDLCPRTLKAKWKNKYTDHVEHTMEDLHHAGYNFSGGILSDQVLKGDQTIWWVFNDMGNTHTETQGQSIGLEIRAQAFAFSTNDEINNMTFYSYEIINRSTYELRETYFSQWVDPDLGYAWDDFVGCDVRRGLGYCYNGKSQDTPGSGSYSGSIPPAVGIDFFQGPYMDPDGLDNPKIDIPKILSPGYDNPQVKALLDTYKRVDSLGNIYYDTIGVTDAADLFFKYDYASWYFHKGDAVGNCAINGVNFGNNIIDDERFGMRRFVYYDNSLDAQHGEPTKASDYYNYLRGYWKNGVRMHFGGKGYGTTNDGTNIDCDFMFPDNSDPWGWGVDSVQLPAPWDQTMWRETTAGNDPRDVRFMQSAGPFTLRPGAVNYITVGIPFAQATSGEDQWASVQLLRDIDDVCQALFENCFKVLDGPDAPTMTCQELSNEIILYLSYEEPTSNNYKEKYREPDPAIPQGYTDELGHPQMYDSAARSYIFEGYQIYQLKDANTSIADINNPAKARLIFQCDIENYYDTLISEVRVVNGDSTIVFYENETPTLPIGTLVNYTTNSATGLITGNVMVEGSNKGIQHVFRVTNDAFATGSSSALVNNKEYYFIAIAYAQNRYKEYSQTEATFLDGQKQPYLAGRKNEKGGSIAPITAIPHNPAVEDGGKMAQAEFGMCPNIIRIEGYGNGGSTLRLTQQSIEELMGPAGVPGKGPGTFRTYPPQIEDDQSEMQNACMIIQPKYEENYGPINVRVIDPLKLRQGRYNIYFKAFDENGLAVPASNDAATVVDKHTRWFMIPEGGHDTVWSDFTISRYNEQLFLDLGLAVSLVNPNVAAGNSNYNQSSNKFKGGMFGGEANGGYFYDGFVKDGAVLSSEMIYGNDHAQWLSGVPDNDSYMQYNWIRSGSQYAPESYKRFQAYSTPDSLNNALDASFLDEDFFKGYQTQSGGAIRNEGIDKKQLYEDVVSGLWAPYGLVSTLPYHPGFNFSYYIADQSIFDSLTAVPGYGSVIVKRNRVERQLMTPSTNLAVNFNELSKLPSVHIVFTADTSKWTRCPVIEMCDDYTQAEGNARKFSARKHASVDKLGRTCADLGVAPNVNSSSNPAYIADSGMGWFPGYAINTVTGERLNIMFGEDSRYIQYNGRDMKWNPTSEIMEGTGDYVFGGRHFVYVMNATNQLFYDLQTKKGDYRYYRTPSYDAGKWAMSFLKKTDKLMSVRQENTSNANLYNGLTRSTSEVLNPLRDSIAFLYASVAWVNIPLVDSRFAFDDPRNIPCDVTVNIDIRAPYNRFLSQNGTKITRPVNNNMPAYQFVINASDAVLENLATKEGATQSYKDSLLSQINVVPNPYYSYSQYETASQLETKVRIVNLPTGINAAGAKEGCTIHIYTVDGTLVRTLGPTPVNATTYDWDLHNQTGIPIAGGVYLIHVSVPGVGERVVKWFGTMRPVDLNSFGF